jgi:lysophospholipase L1-like esterase
MLAMSAASADDVCRAPLAPHAGVDRQSAPPPSDDARRLRTLARRLRAPGGVVEDPCVEGGGQRRCVCLRTALEPFYAALDHSVARGRRTGIVVFGNSLIASDGITGALRARLTERFGDGGRGLLLVDRQAEYGWRHRTAARASGWRVESTTATDAAARAIGVAGLRHQSAGPAGSVFPLAEGERAAIVWHDIAGGGEIRFRVDDGPVSSLPRRADGSVRYDDVGGGTVLELQADDGAVLHGVTLERGGGVVVDAFGVVGAVAGTWLRADETVFAEELLARAPSLVVVMLGGNESKHISWGYAGPKRVEAELAAFVDRVRDAAPGAACLVVGPIDSVERDDPVAPFRQRATLEPVIAAERRIALARGCAFFALFRAMGGAGSLKRLHEAGLLHDDLTHPRDRALDMLGQLLADALLDAYARSRPSTGETLVSSAR